ncbi:purine-nucleoside phosphorylase [Truepera radiovictrix]|nr:purine-nucleoside phosphorylase [Truepera radiovictrix]WMT58609.1 purine-nucleoside phosphorylase [Truepera radiovictrix]
MPLSEAPPLQRTLHDAVDAVRAHTDFAPEIALILGSGLGPLADEIAAQATLPYREIPGFAPSTAPGHAGELILGTLAGRDVVAMKGRLHVYEGITAAQAAFPVRLMHALGARSLVVSNACGGLNPHFRAGEIMLQLDFINFTGTNALIGPNDEALGPRFPVAFDAYDPEYLETARAVARREDIRLCEGVYLAISGPSYASRAELRMFRGFGADAIGMSTVHEVLVARHQGLRVLGLSVVTDMALPDGERHADEGDVLETAARTGPTFRRLVKALLPHL